MNFVTINGINIHFQLRTAATTATGPGPVIVFANSLGTDFRIWDNVVDDLSADFTCLRYDKRGHGLSDLGTVPYHLEDHVADLAGLLDYLKIDKAVVCGLSVGGLIAQGLYATRPDVISGLVLCDTGHKIGTRDLWQDRIDALEAGGLAPMVDAVMERWFTEDFRRDDNPVFRGARAMFERQDARGYSATCAAIRDADLTAEARQITVPTLCLVGDQDGATPPALVEELAGLIEPAAYKIIEDCGHIPCLEQPQRLVALIRDFLKNYKVKSAHG